jgi:sensor c-di-GMP phosphodiesterase-like protein
VETREQVDFLRTMGCDIMQGYYIGHAVAHDEFVRLLERGIAPEPTRDKGLSPIETRFPRERVSAG